MVEIRYIIAAKQCDVAGTSSILDGLSQKILFLDTHLISTMFLATQHSFAIILLNIASLDMNCYWGISNADTGHVGCTFAMERDIFKSVLQSYLTNTESDVLVSMTTKRIRN